MQILLWGSMFCAITLTAFLIPDSDIQALFQNNASNNTAVGFNALFSNTIGNGNVAIGSDALSLSAIVGVYSPDGANVAIGPAALQHTNGTGSFSGGGNNAVGQDALRVTRQDLPTTRLVLRHFPVTPLEPKTRPLAIRRCSAAPTEAATRPWRSCALQQYHWHYQYSPGL